METGARPALLWLALLLATPPLRAQIVNDGASTTLNNFTNTFAAVTVGTNGSFTLLVLSNNVQLTNSGNSTIGLNITARSNEVRLISPSARWQSGNSLFVGSNGPFNRLVVSNGASAFTANSSFIGQAPGANSNSATVTGPGTRWQAGTLFVGDNAEANSLVVSQGGQLECSFAELGRNAPGANNQALLTGAGSLWTMPGSLLVGDAGSGNRLIVSNGAAARCDLAFIGFFGADNTALVTGSGSVWTNASLLVGRSGSNNRLIASNGATVLTTAHGFIGFNANANINSATITDPGTRWLINSNFYVGTNGASGLLVVSNAALLENLQGVLGSSGASSNNSALVTGAGTVWSNRGSLNLGESSRGNRLVVSNGATVYAGTDAVIGLNSGAISNSATVTGPGTSWLVTSNLYVGSNGVFNLLVISNGAAVVNNNGLVSGGSLGASNRVLVTGTGSIWNNRVGLVIGNQSGGSRLVVNNGGMVLNGGCTLGVNASSNNSVQVTGAGSVWSNALLLRIGSFGVGNRVVVEDGARLDTEDASVGAFSANNEAVITGAGSLWTNRDQLSVGGVGSGNRLVISNAAVASTVTALIVGESSVSTNNRVVVDGGTLRATNAVGTSVLDVRRGTNVLNAGLIDVDWLLLTNTLGKFQFNGGTLVTRGAFITNNEPFVVGTSGNNPAVWDLRPGAGNHSLKVPLFLGDSASLNQMLITDGAVLSTSGNALVGANIGGNSNTVLLAGLGSKWEAGSLTIGYYGAFNRLIVSNGATAECFQGGIGYDTTSSNNLALVTGAGSVWSNATSLLVGTEGAGNRLVVSNGAAVIGDAAAIGYGVTSSNNLAMVTGSGSVWSNAGSFYVGVIGAGNRLVVSNGGAVFGNSGVIGLNAASSNNLAVVTGPGSIWSNAAVLFVGSNSFGNRLVISNGGFVAATDPARPMFIGYEPNSSNNEVVITGSGSVYSNVFGFNVDLGENGSSNRLTIANGGLFVANVIIGDGQSSSGNALTVTDPGSRIFVPRNDLELIVGADGSRNLMVVSNGAAVIGDGAAIGSGVTSSNNLAVVTGSGSLWSNQNTLQVGSFGPNNRLLVTDGGTVTSTNAVNVGRQSTTSSNNLLHIVNGTLRVTNQIVTGTLDIRRGTNRLDSGLIEVDILRITNGALSKFEFNGGTLSAKSSRVSIGNLLSVGNGVSPATFILAGNGLHNFTGTLGLIVSSNATVTGNGTIGGAVPLQLLAGSRLVPGASVGKIVLSNSPVLSGAVIMEISKDPGPPGLTNDQIQVIAPLAYGGSLMVSNLGSSALAAGDRFPLFSATSYSGGFTNISLPSLAAGLAWTNKMVFDGSIEVVGVSQPRIASIIVSGTNIIISGSNGPPNAFYAVLASTNVALPLSNWVSLVTNQFDSSGNFSFTNAVVPGIPQRFYRIRTP